MVIPEPSFLQNLELLDANGNDPEQIHSFVNKQAVAHPGIPAGMRQNLLNRLDWLYVIKADERRHLRHKRGLINAGGWLLSKLFGTATSGQVEKLKELVQQGYEQRVVLSHRTNELASSYNQMVKEVNQTRAYLAEHGEAIGKLKDDVKKLVEAVNNNKLDALIAKKGMLLNDLVSTAERRHDIVREQYQTYLAQRRALEAGRLTEEVLLRADLESIIEKAQSMGYRGATPEWYYEHSQIRPLWDHEEGMSYVVELPMGKEEVTGYHLQTFPDYKEDTDQWTKLVVHEYLGYDERDGTVFVLKGCKGAYPVLCEKDMNYHSGLPCERSLILGTSEGLSRCRVRLETPKESTALSVGINSHILTTKDSALEARCMGEPTEVEKVSPGTHQVTFAASGCQLQGKGGWVLESVDVHQEKLELLGLEVELGNLTLPDIPRLDLLEEPAKFQLHQVQGVELKMLKAYPPLHPLRTLTHEAMNSYILIGIIAFLVLLGCVITLYWMITTGRCSEMMRRKRAGRRFWWLACCKKGRESEGQEVCSLNRERAPPTAPNQRCDIIPETLDGIVQMVPRYGPASNPLLPTLPPRNDQPPERQVDPEGYSEVPEVRRQPRI